MVKNNRKLVMLLFTVVFVMLLAACGNASEQSSAAADNPAQKSENTEDDAANVDSTETTSVTDNNETTTNDPNEKADTASTVPGKDSSASNSTANVKEAYLKKLNDTKQEMDDIRKNSKETTTYAMKKMEGDRYDAWDDLLNEVYGVLEEQLAPEVMEPLREEQRNWITTRDKTAKEASLKYEGGTMEQLEYVAVLANLTEERSYELVEGYMQES